MGLIMFILALLAVWLIVRSYSNGTLFQYVTQSITDLKKTIDGNEPARKDQKNSNTRYILEPLQDPSRYYKDEPK